MGDERRIAVTAGDWPKRFGSPARAHRTLRACADPAYRVELTARFLDRLESIEALLAEADARHAYDALLSIRHHRQLSFDFARLWPGPGQNDV